MGTGKRQYQLTKEMQFNKGLSEAMQGQLIIYLKVFIVKNYGEKTNLNKECNKAQHSQNLITKRG